MAEQEQDKLLTAYPKLAGYIKAARKRGYSDEEIDAGISEGFSARKKAGKSDQEIADDFGYSLTPDAPGPIKQALGSFSEAVTSRIPSNPFRGGPDLTGEQRRIERVPGEPKHAMDSVLDTAGVLGEKTVGPFREGYRTAAQGVAVDAPYAIAQATDNDTVGGLLESLLSGVIPGVGNPNFPGTQAADDYLTKRYPGMDPMVASAGPSRLGLGLPIPGSAAPAVGRAGTALASKAGRLGPALAAFGELGTVGADFDLPPVGKLDWSASDAGGIRGRMGQRINPPEPILPRGFQPESPMRQVASPGRDLAPLSDAPFLDRVTPGGTNITSLDGNPASLRSAADVNISRYDEAAKWFQDNIGARGPQESQPWPDPVQGTLPGMEEFPRQLLPPNQWFDQSGRVNFPEVGPARELQGSLEFPRVKTVKSKLQPPHNTPISAERALGEFDPGAAKHWENAQNAGRMEGLTPEQKSLAFSNRRSLVNTRKKGKLKPPAGGNDGRTVVKSDGVWQDSAAQVRGNQSLAKVPGQGVVDSTRYKDLEINNRDIGKNRPFPVRAPVDAQGRFRESFWETAPSGPAKAGGSTHGYDQGELNPAAKRESAELDKYMKSEFNAGPGTSVLNDLDAGLSKLSEKIKAKTERTPADQALSRLVASFQRKKGRTINTAREEIKRATKELLEAKKSGKYTQADITATQETLEKAVKDIVAAQNRAHRNVLVKAAKKFAPHATRRDILAAAGEIDALSEGLAIGPWQRGFHWLGEKGRTGVGLFKTVKVLGSTTAYANNIGSVLVSSYFAGLSPKDIGLLSEAVSDLYKNGPEMKKAINAGLFGTEFFSKDLSTLFRELELATKGKRTSAEALEEFWGKYTGKAAAAYDGIDKVFKLATFIKATREGVNTSKIPFGKGTKLRPREAVEHVNLFFPNYERLGPGMQRFRKATSTALAVNPFLAFPLEYARIYKNAATHKPFHFAGAVGAVGGLYAWGEMTSGPSSDRPGYADLPGKLSLPVPFTRDSRGENWRVDLTYIMPLADTFGGFSWNSGRSVSDNILGSAAHPERGLFSSAVKNLLGRGIFSSQDAKFEKPGEPGMIESLGNMVREPSVNNAQQVLRNQPVPVGQKVGALGRKRGGGEDPGPLREAGEFVGARLTPDSAIQRDRAKGEFEARVSELEKEMARITNDKSLKREERVSRRDKLREQLRNLRRSRR